MDHEAVRTRISSGEIIGRRRLGIDRINDRLGSEGFSVLADAPRNLGLKYARRMLPWSDRNDAPPCSTCCRS
ncbi:MAG: hypothetical protein JST25_04610 [Actinobacteria bacterium]|nr:hypothetical protein [Actinomycetota bacterium]